MFRRLLLLISLAFAPLAALRAESGAEACAFAPREDPLRALTLVDPEARLFSGSSFALDWSVPLPPGTLCPGATWLVLSLPPEVRLSGEGFFPLMPGEGAPFGIAPEGADARMRVWIPLHLLENTAGRLEVTPWLIGPMQISWSLWHQPVDPSAREALGAPLLLAERQFTREVAPGRPRLVLQDLHVTEAPREVIPAPGGRQRLEVFPGWFRLVDTETGLVTHSGQGRRPGFSRTGRFLHSFGQPFSLGDAALFHDELRITDLLTGARVFQTRSPNRELLRGLWWSEGDSLLLIGSQTWGTLGFVQPLTDRPPVFTPMGGARQLLPEENAVVQLRLEDSHLRLGWGHGDGTAANLGRYSLAGPSFPGDDPGHELTSAWQVDRAEVLPLPGWMPDPLTGAGLTLLLDGGAPAGSEAEATDLPDVFDPRGAVPLSGGEIPLGPRDRFIERLRDFGIDLAALDQPARQPVTIPAFPDPEASSLLAHDPALPLIEDRLLPMAERTAWNRTVIGAKYATDFDFDGILGFDSWHWQGAGGPVQYLHLTQAGGSASAQYGALLRIRMDASGAMIGEQLLHSRARDDSLPEGLRDASGQPVTLAVERSMQLLRWGPGRTLLADAEGQVVLLDDESSTIVTRITRTESFEDLRFAAGTSDGNHVLLAERDGRFAIHPLAGGPAVLEGRWLDDELVVHDSRMRFDATPEGERHGWMRFPGDPGLHVLSQIAEARRMPGLAAATLAGHALPDPGDFILPPRLRLVEAGPGKARVEIIAPAGVAELLVHRDGMPILTRALRGDTRITLDLDLPALPESRGFALEARDAAGQASLPLLLTADPPPGPPQGRLRVLAIGTDRYMDPFILDLRHAASDAQRFAAAVLAQPPGRYRDVSAEVLADTPDLSAVLAARLATIAADLRPEDTLILHIAGHGFLAPDGRFHLAIRETEVERLQATALPWSDVLQGLGQIEARVLVLIDACHSGAGQGMETEGASEEAVAEVRRMEGRPITVIAAAKGREFSLESTAWGGGVFTSAVIAALAAPDLDSFYGQIKREVAHRTLGRQTPWIARAGMLGVVPLF